ncbi:dTDP-4-dehydrorhamnose reductase [Psychroserpens sp. MEBiC05023]
MKNILVTGANGQLGQSLKAIREKYPNLNFIFTDKTSLDITSIKEVNRFFKSNHFDWCINCAAYTLVDKAESDIENAKRANVSGVRNLAKISKESNVKMIHVSTDFVFDGYQNNAYIETASTRPLNTYGRTKLEGEKELIKENSKHFIVRTSWLYSEFGQNFLKTMLRLAKERSEIKIVSDQIGTPTYARDLSVFLLKIINNDSNAYGVYHYSNEGLASWYDFAKAIFDINGNDLIVKPINTSLYPTAAQRPLFSVLDKTKTKQEFNLDIPYWRDSLKTAILNL